MTTGHRHDLPQARGDRLLTDGGLETTLIFHRGFELPEFAAFPLLDTHDGRAALVDYFRSYLDIAVAHGVGIVLETPTWRASADWGALIGYDAAALRQVNTAAVDLLRDLRSRYESDDTPVVISGCVGPRGDGYVAGEEMTPEEADSYHRTQVQTFADAGADLVTFVTATSSSEAIGFLRAAERAGIPAVVSFTVETDGRIPAGQPLAAAIEQVDADTGSFATCFGINCAHPDHFSAELTGATWEQRIGLLRANASRRSHEELDEADELDAGDAAELAQLYRRLRDVLPNLNVMGGCCGTDDSHIAAIAETCFGPPRPRNLARSTAESQ
ncbi:MAG TPA: homocysteine S-methyltransferase family protein [Acidimicrobiales bacterium]|jgi:S-methylmethionine-dependent homocysteine/selenocysteine methylase